MRYGSEWDRDADYIERVTSYHAHNLAGTSGFASYNVDDIQQELIIDLVKRLPKYDARKSGRRTFISRLARNHALTLAKGQEAQKCDYRKEAHSLDEEIDRDSDDSTTRLDRLSSDEYERRLRGTQLPNEERRDLQIDIQSLLQRITPQQREICLLLIQGESASSTAKLLGISRSTLYERQSVLRSRMRREGFSFRK